MAITDHILHKGKVYRLVMRPLDPSLRTISVQTEAGEEIAATVSKANDHKRAAHAALAYLAKRGPRP